MLKLDDLNGVRVAVSAVVLEADVSITLGVVKAPYLFPPNPAPDFYYLTLVDYVNRPEAWEIIKVTAVSGQTLTVERNIASSTGAAIQFEAGAVVQWTPSVFDIQGGGSGNIVLSIGAGFTNLYYLPSTHFAALGYTYIPIANTDVSASSMPLSADTYIRWYNNTGKNLTVSQLFVNSTTNTNVGIITFMIQKNSVDTALFIDWAIAEDGPIVRNTTDSFVLADGAYISLKVSSSATINETGDFSIDNLQLIIS